MDACFAPLSCVSMLNMKTQRHPHVRTIFGSDRQSARPNEVTMDYNGGMGGRGY